MTDSALPIRPHAVAQWGAGGKGTEVEFVGLPVGGKPHVMKTAESPLGIHRTAERRSQSVYMPGEVPGFHFRSWDGWLWFEVGVPMPSSVAALCCTAQTEPD